MQASWISVDVENKTGMDKWTVKTHLMGDKSCTINTKMVTGAGFTMAHQLPD